MSCLICPFAFLCPLLAGKSRTPTLEWQRENDLDHSHGAKLNSPSDPVHVVNPGINLKPS